MTVKRRPKLRLSSAGKQNFIQVPSGHASDLVGYLRRNGFGVAPPEPCDRDTEIVALVGKVNPASVQAVLDRWD